MALASVVAALPDKSLSKPAAISKVSSVAPANPEVASRDAPLALVSTIVSPGKLLALAEAISSKAKLTLAVVSSSPLMSHDSLLQSSRSLMLVVGLSNKLFDSSNVV